MRLRLTELRDICAEHADPAAVESVMHEWKRASRQALISGAASSILSAVALAALGRIENGSAAGPVNGPSQWVHGRSAAYRRSASLRHTLVGFLIHHAMSTGWAVLHERLFGRDKQTQTPAKRLGRAALTAATANFVDYKLTPKRLQPGFEAQLSKKSLVVVYAAFAVGLALFASGASTRQKRPRRQ
jgi:hypothetical protein